MPSHYTNRATYTSVFSTKSDNGALGAKALRVVRYQRQSRPLCLLPSDNKPSAPITTVLRFLPRTICAVFFLRCNTFTFYLKQYAAQSDLTVYILIRGKRNATSENYITSKHSSSFVCHVTYKS